MNRFAPTLLRLSKSAISRHQTRTLCTPPVYRANLTQDELKTLDKKYFQLLQKNKDAEKTIAVQKHLIADLVAKFKSVEAQKKPFLGLSDEPSTQKECHLLETVLNQKTKISSLEMEHLMLKAENHKMKHQIKKVKSDYQATVITYALSVVSGVMVGNILAKLFFNVIF
ncbi:hypothetical protein L596_021870 [Steinernema carpocapsae]|uniref:Uncharacterized protein n=1 Tax=Steinernema carpocapsae TaxID=34508 RepID=A0A4U5MK27_STECR|nr:hypothetical protein L596_021870 [Steinernema carpocapsae]